ncbi:MAG: hypothetical protein UY48_C0006G0002 [Candidatus Gottesmanbacteria bacterium GW2011_GWB1_49_7]|uniref:Uncharacterized protein n=1 Tax=Candidatus Gottesmanbacteria bacterium GW2011_GWB1_49_7 TaxID=1618448 RepID=A0A0G1Z2F5_9BACT|nr:MAG: hypothetical protein UY48_C0006G0002 [Candidatus Gottesmanbacteria bacterium GW2011_GWB1_49_7]
MHPACIAGYRDYMKSDFEAMFHRLAIDMDKWGETDEGRKLNSLIFQYNEE